MIKQNKEMKPTLIEESTSQDIPQHVEIILMSLCESFPAASRNDVMCVLLYILMIETGFIPQNIENCDLSNSTHNFSIQTLNSIHNMPCNWKNTELNFYEILFHLGKFSKYPCKLVIIPTGEVLITNLVISNLSEERRTYSITIQVSRYIPNLSDFIASSFRHLEDLSFKFKNNVSHPARCSILNYEQILNPSLVGLPDEIKIRILKKLRLKDLINMSMLCKNFNVLCEDWSLWRYFVLKDFGFDSEDRDFGSQSNINLNTRWKEKYRSKYLHSRKVAIRDYWRV